MKRMGSLVLVLAMLVMCLSGCSLLGRLFDGQEKPKPTAESTQDVEAALRHCVIACNNEDVDGILDCIAPEIAKPAKTMLNLAGKLGDKSETELLGTVIGLLGAEDSSDAAQVCKTLEVTEFRDIKVDGAKATAEVSFAYEQDGTRYVGDTTVTCKCIDGKWYIYTLSAE